MKMQAVHPQHHQLALRNNERLHARAMQGRGQSVALSQTQSTVRISYCVRSEINVWGVATMPMFGALWQGVVILGLM